MDKDEMEKGPQPLDTLMIQLNIKNSDLVEQSTAQLTHKVVAKARKGRRLTLHSQLKILKAFKAMKPEKNYTLADLFNYSGKE